jgi:hypothetical protein
MLKNFVVDADLKKYYPTLASYLPPSYADFSTQIGEAFNLLQDELVAKGYEPRKLMLPLDLGRPLTETAAENVLTSISATGAGAQTHIDGLAGFRRGVINAISLGGSTVIVWEGSNDQDISDSVEPTNWTLIKQWTVSAVGVLSFVTVDEYRYYRVRVVSVAAGTTVFTAAIYETYADRWIMWKTFQLIFSSMSKSPDDVWAERATQAQSNFETALSAYKVMVDEDDDNQVDPNQTRTTTQTQFTL